MNIIKTLNLKFNYENKCIINMYNNMIGKNKITSTSIPNLIKKSISLSILVYSTSIMLILI